MQVSIQTIIVDDDYYKIKLINNVRYIRKEEKHTHTKWFMPAFIFVLMRHTYVHEKTTTKKLTVLRHSNQNRCVLKYFWCLYVAF